jgi:hypothetical protein
MAGRNGRYPNSKVGFEQNNNAGSTDRFFIDHDGFFNVAGDVGGGDIRGDQLYELLGKKLNAIYRPVLSTTAGSLATSMVNLLSTTGVVLFSVTSNWVNCSFWINSCSVGREAVLMCRVGSATGASAIIWVSTSGCSIVSPLGLAISGFFMRTSAASTALVELRCFIEGEWSVVDTKGGYAEA